MHSAFRRATIAALVVAFLAPGLIHARPVDPSARLNAASEVSRGGGFFEMVWNLLTELVLGRGLGSPTVANDTTTDPGDNGGHLDPSGVTTTTTPTTTTSG